MDRDTGSPNNYCYIQLSPKVIVPKTTKIVVLPTKHIHSIQVSIPTSTEVLVILNLILIYRYSIKVRVPTFPEILLVTSTITITHILYEGCIPYLH